MHTWPLEGGEAICCIRGSSAQCWPLLHSFHWGRRWRGRLRGRWRHRLGCPAAAAQGRPGRGARCWPLHMRASLSMGFRPCKPFLCCLVLPGAITSVSWSGLVYQNGIQGPYCNFLRTSGCSLCSGLISDCHKHSEGQDMGCSLAAPGALVASLSQAQSAPAALQTAEQRRLRWRTPPSGGCARWL